MSYSVSLAKSYKAAFDEKLSKGNRSGVFDALFSWAGADTVLIAKSNAGGLGNYNKAAGYDAGDVAISWESMQLSQRRAKKYGIDFVDNEETMNQALPATMQNIMVQIEDEIDQYVFAKIANTNTVTAATPATLTSGTDVLAAITLGETSVLNGKGRLADCALIINVTNYQKLRNEIPFKFTKGQDPDTNFEYFDGMQIVLVEDSLLYKGSQYNTTTGAIEPLADANGDVSMVNFIIANKNAVAVPKKLIDFKTIDHSVNQNSAADLIIPDIRYDAFVLDNKAATVYVHAQPAA